MIGFMFRRLALSIGVFFLVSVLVFAIVEVLPGDAATAYLGRGATPEGLAEVRKQLRLDRPAPIRFYQWLTALFQGDLGVSLARQEPVAKLIIYRLRNSLLLGISAALLGIPFALLLGVIAALNRDRLLDHVLSTGTMLGMSLPEFVTGTLVIFLFSLRLKWLPAVTVVRSDATVREILPFIVLPGITLIIVFAGYVARLMRSSLLDVLSSEYVKMAALKGLPSWYVVLRHAFPNAVIPTVASLALLIAGLIGNLLVIEAVFNYPGIGKLMLTAMHDRDLPLVQGIAVVLAGAYILVNLVADLSLRALNPRIRTRRS